MFKTGVRQDHTCPLWCTLTVVGVDSINTLSSIHTLMTRTIIHIAFTVVTLKPWNDGSDELLCCIDTDSHKVSVY